MRACPLVGLAKRQRLGNVRWVVWLLHVPLLAALFHPAASLGQIPVTLVYQNGTTVFVELVDEAFPGIDEATGEPRPIPWSEIRCVIFRKAAGSSEREIVATAIAKLDAADYQEREEAETKLLQLPTLQNYRGLLQAELDHPSLEKRYRVARILKQIDRSRSTTARTRSPRPALATEQDFVRLKTGQTRILKLAQQRIACRWRGQVIQLATDQLERIVSGWPKLAADVDATPRMNRVQVVQASEQANDWRDAPEWNFAVDRGGFSLEPFHLVQDEFVDRGVRLFSERNFQVIVADISNVTNDGPVLKSLCVYDGEKSRRIFSGRIRVSFCLPDLPEIPATVDAVGFQLAIIDNPKDVVMDAYDAEGRIITRIEAGGERNQFFGLRSEIPIAFVEMKLNEHLQTLDRDIDKSYSLQTFRHSSPRPATTYVNRRPDYAVRLRSGEVWFVPELAWDDGALRIDDAVWGPVEIPLAEIAAIQGPESPWREPSSRASGCFVKLADGSIFKCDPQDGLFVSTRQPLWRVRADNVEAIWFPKDELRYPREDDFSETWQVVLVFPTCRWLLPELKVTPRDIAWDTRRGELKLPELLPTIKEAYTRENDLVTPRFDSFALVGSRETQSPSVWFAPVRSASQPMVLLRNGERFDLAAHFKLAAVDGDALVLTDADGLTWKIKWSEVALVKF